MVKKNVHNPTPSSPATISPSVNQASSKPSTAAGTPARSTPSTTTTFKSPASKHSQAPQDILSNIWVQYQETTPQRVRLIDAFLGFLVVVGVLQFAYVVVVGNYPFNAFLAGFSATVGQFVLTASLRMQTNPANAKEFSTVGDERAFADYVFGSLILHFFCVNFIN